MATWSKKTARWIVFPFAVLLLAGALGLGAQLFFRWREAKAYDDAPACAGAATTAEACKTVTDGTLEEVTCDPKRWWGACEYAFKVPIDGATATRRVLTKPANMEGMKAGDRVKLELFQGHITRLAAKGELATVTGTPTFAVNALGIAVPLAFVCGLLLLRLGLRIKD